MSVNIACIKCGTIFPHCGCPSVPKICPKCITERTEEKATPAECGRLFNDLIALRDKLLIAKNEGKFNAVGISNGQVNILLGQVFTAINMSDPCFNKLTDVEEMLKTLD